MEDASATETTWTPGEILALRERLGLSSREMARRLGVSEKTVIRWERGERRPARRCRWRLRVLAQGER